MKDWREEKRKTEEIFKKIESDLMLGIGEDSFEIKHNLSDEDIKKIDKEVKVHKCDPKYLQVYLGDIGLWQCVKCGLIIPKRKRICKICKQPYSLVYSIEGCCSRCSETKTLGDFK